MSRQTFSSGRKRRERYVVGDLSLQIGDFLAKFHNRNRQIVVRPTDLPGNDHLQRVYVLRCEPCGANMAQMAVTFGSAGAHPAKAESPVWRQDEPAHGAPSGIGSGPACDRIQEPPAPVSRAHRAAAKAEPQAGCRPTSGSRPFR